MRILELCLGLMEQSAFNMLWWLRDGLRIFGAYRLHKRKT